MDPFELYNDLYRPSSILWNGESIWVCLEGVTSDVESQAANLNLEEVASPPDFPQGGRHSLEPSALRKLQRSSETWLAEIGVGVVHCSQRQTPAPLGEANKRLMRELEDRLDPNGRLNPGRELITT